MDDITLPPGGAPHKGAAVEPGYMEGHARDLRIDLLRGYFVLAMVIDHVHGPSPLYWLTGGNRFFTSAAEGFILTSGLVAGLVYRRLIERDGLAPSLLKLLARALSLYLLTVGLTLLFVPISETLYLPWAQGVDLSRAAEFVVSILTLHRTYYLVDVMLLYTVLFVIAPLAFILILRGKGWVVLALSWGLWGLFQFFPDATATPWPIAGNYLFQLSAWQVLFFTGLALGSYAHRIPTLSCRATRRALLVTGILVVVLIASYFVIDPPNEASPQGLELRSPLNHTVRLWLDNNLLPKADLRPGRLIASALIFSFLFLAATHFWQPARRWLGWLLLPLGQHALYAYTAHVIIVAIAGIALLPFKIAFPGPQWLNLLIQVAAVALVWVLVRFQFLAPTRRTRPYWNAVPALLAAAALIVLPLLPNPSHPGLAAPPVDPAAAEARAAARRYGTPIPPEALAAAPAGAPTPALLVPVTPEPPALPAPGVLSDGELRISRYVGDIRGSVRERWFYSPALDLDMPYYVYLPPDYGTAGRRYPVLYMLHGGGGHREEWLVYGLIDTADQAILSGALLPLIIVLPQGDRGLLDEPHRRRPPLGRLPGARPGRPH